MKRKRVTIRITDEQYLKLIKTIGQQKLTLSSLFRQILDDKLDEIVVRRNSIKNPNKGQ